MKFAHDIIRKPIISERSMETTFDKNGNEIKKAVEEVFGVKVAAVNTMRKGGKEKRMGRFVGKTAAWKKAIVTLAADSKTIEFFDM